MNAIKINDLVKKYGDFLAVDNISLAVREKEIYGLLGPNGAGKSTIINIISGILRKSKGTVEVLSYDIDKNSKSIKQNLGVVPQDIAIYEDLTALENVKFFASLYGLKGKQLIESSIEALEFVGLNNRQREFPKSFSGGMKRRLNIACAIAHKPKVIIMDEPTVGIDPQSRNHILNSVKKLNQLGCTIIYTSHYMEEVESICTKIGIIDHGKLIAEGSKEELKAIITDSKLIKIELENFQEIDIEKLKIINGVENVTIEKNFIIIESKKSVSNLDKIILFFTGNNLPILNIKSEEPNLESVFLSLTGRKLRD